MSYQTAQILRDVNGNPIPQYYDTEEGLFKPMTNEMNVANLPAIQNVQVQGSYVGYAADTKPTEGINKGDDFLELDTKDVYIYDGTQWVVF